MAQFVQYDAHEEQHRHQHAPNEPAHAASHPTVIGCIGEQQEERRVHRELYAKDTKQVN